MMLDRKRRLDARTRSRRKVIAGDVMLVADDVGQVEKETGSAGEERLVKGRQGG